MKFHIPAFLAGVIALTVFILTFSEAYAQIRTITFPVDGKYSFRDDFAEPRGGGTREHLGIDIIADKMTPVVAAVDGTITYIAIPQASWGYSITIRDSEGYTYRYLHLNNDTPGTDDGQGGEANAYASDLRRRSEVTKGQLIGWVGDSGNAEATVSHLHFEIRGPDRVNLNPYQTLITASENGGSNQSTVEVEHASEGGIENEEQSVATYILELSQGQRGEAVRVLQEKLSELGYFSGGATGYFGPVTKAAVVAFQKANGIDPIGIVGPKTRAALDVAGVPIAGPSFTFTKYLAQGVRSEEVRQLQLLLMRDGYFNENPTGYFGRVTRNAVIAFQRAEGIEPLGVVGPKTRVALNAL